VAIRIFQHYWQLPLALLATAEALVFLFSPYVASLLHADVGVSGLEGGLLARASLFAGVMFITMTAMGLYNARQRSRLLGVVTRLAASVFAGVMLMAVFYYLFPNLQMGRSEAACRRRIAQVVRAASGR
jgi:hypothetical protein